MAESAVWPTFIELFDSPADVRADAPGRVNLIGEHTDYHDGFVLPCAIPQRTRIEMRRGSGTQVRLWSTEHPNTILTYVIGQERRTGTWVDYIAGITVALAQLGHRVSGFDIRVDSDVPLGAGLSSSAALEVAALRAVRELYGLRIDDVQIARIGQSAEVEFVGAPVGIMDQMAASLAAEREALFLDTRSLDYTRVPLPSSLDLIVLTSGVVHQHSGGDYALRRRESEEAARRLGVSRLREVSIAMLDRVNALPPLLARRARHIVTENQRVIGAVRALREDNPEELGRLFDASHASMRDDYEVSVAEVDLLVECGRADPDVWGARLTGGGFGGSVVMIARSGSASAAANRIAVQYSRQSGRQCRVLIPA